MCSTPLLPHQTLLGAEDTARSKTRRLLESGGSHASGGCWAVDTTVSGSGKYPEENKHERDVLLWMVSEGLSKEVAFEVSK